MKRADFQEIGHTGGKVKFTVVTDEHGNRSYQIGWTHSAPHSSVLTAVWALPQGVAIANLNMGGIGTPWNPPPVSGCFPVMIGSDTEGKFGHQCPKCSGYWRSDASPTMCPYCAMQADRYMFLSDAQQQYVERYCARLNEALHAPDDGDHIIDMDAVADAVGKEGEKPSFYYAEESQQKQFNCTTCGAFNDILGKFCYCSTCGTRNDFHELVTQTLANIRSHINADNQYESSVVDVVSAFDSYTRQLVKQMIDRIPLRSARKAKLTRMKFHNLQTAADEIKAAFDIDIFSGATADDVEFAKIMFHRRHVYEHNGSEVDEKYIADSGDTSVRLKQAIKETKPTANRIVSLVEKMAKNIDEGFHDIFPPKEEPIKRHVEKQSRFKATTKV